MEINSTSQGRLHGNLAFVKRSTSFFFSLVILLLLTAIYYRSLIVIEDTAVQMSNGPIKKIELPFKESTSGGDDADLTFKFEFSHGPWKQTKLNFVPDDKVVFLSVNGSSVDLTKINEGRVDDWSRGFNLDIRPLLLSGRNTIMVKVKNMGGLYGLSVANAGSDPLNMLLLTLLALVSCHLAYLTLGNLGFGKTSTALLMSGFLIRLLYLFNTHFSERGHDVWFHLGYIDSLMAWTLPDKIMTHPPLYYLACSAIANMVRFLGAPGREAIYSSLMVYSLALSFGFCAVSVKLIESSLRRCSDLPEKKLRFLILLGSALLIFWPSTIIHQIRIGNEVQFYLLFLLSLFFITKWHQSGETKYAVRALLLTALAIATKVTALILIPIMCACCTVRILKSQSSLQRYRFRELATPVLLLSLSLVVVFAPITVDKIINSEPRVIMKLSQMSRNLFVGNKAENLLYFDLKTFLTKPYTSALDDSLGRQSYPNYLLKTALFGEFSFPGNLKHNAAIIMSLLLVLMLAYLTYAALLTRKISWIAELPITLCAIFLILAQIVIRICFPVNIDFRHISPILVPLCIFYVISIERFNRAGLNFAAYTGGFMALAFVSASICFFAAI